MAPSVFEVDWHEWWKWYKLNMVRWQSDGPLFPLFGQTLTEPHILMQTWMMSACEFNKFKKEDAGLVKYGTL